ncbi:MAG TPA: enoyl-CoA hydratase/isomerase family protein [Jatrophihabitantaceae bacterium]|nr:enoyl-CoA hydratase/isomerase family protein [Jatrophihabitantaceae bacterium]
MTEIPPEAGFRVDVSDAVATVTLSRPERLNAQTPHTWIWLRRVGLDLPGTVRVVVVRGAGRAFSAGLDRAMFSVDGVDGAPGLMALAAAPTDDATATIAGYQEGFGWLARPDLVSVAAVRGHAIGAGFQLALACDLRVIADDAQFTMAETSLGLVPDLGGTKRLVELVGYSRATEICLTGRRVAAEEALRIGLASTVVAADDLDGAVDATVQALLKPPRDALIETKALLLAASGRSQSEQEIAEREAQHRRLRSLAQLD